ncbi:MAG TPA: hypothetical protein VEL79_13695 [Vicinamibacterales bacterium]|nr:hypothetical protein [Vicinamibacterales bacterium]
MANRLWQRWKRFAHRAAEIQSFVVLTLLYWIVVVPIGLIRRLGRRSAGRPDWKVRSESPPIAIEDARRQF